jgi:hypothetical protein
VAHPPGAPHQPSQPGGALDKWTEFLGLIISMH